jgi:serine/threonine-protein kinase RsbT
MAIFKESFNIKGNDFIHAGEAAIRVKNLLKSLNISPDLIRRVAICGYEGEMNAVMHGGGGVLNFEIDDDRITMDISDQGPGIEDIDRAMQKGFSTASDEFREMGFGAGMGLPNMEKNADRIVIESGSEKGTRVQMLFNIDGKEEKA